MMLKKLSATGFLAILLVAFSCQKVPITGRSQVHVIPESELIGLAVTQYQQTLQESKVVTGTAEATMVNTVGKRISDAAVELMKKMKEADRLSGYAWEYHLLQNNVPNAWCLPGGKIAVYTGILPYTKTEAGLAVVIGHEVGHAIAQHGNERMTQQLAAQAGGVGLSILLADQPVQTQQIFQTVYGVGAQYGALLPFSRLQESEADKIGLVLMALAGYDPREAVGLWERMKQIPGSGSTPEFMNTHPSDDRRIADIKAYLPDAMKFYKK